VGSGWSAAAGGDLPQEGAGVANGLVVPDSAAEPLDWLWAFGADQPISSISTSIERM
jgi:hypothetical protein